MFVITFCFIKVLQISSHFLDFFSGSYSSYQIVSERIALSSSSYIYNCVFSKISSSTNGGALSYIATTGYIVIEDTSFEEITSSGSYGGALYVSQPYGCALNRVCGYLCFGSSSLSGSFGFVEVSNTNQVNLLSILSCPSYSSVQANLHSLFIGGGVQNVISSNFSKSRLKEASSICTKSGSSFLLQFCTIIECISTEQIVLDFYSTSTCNADYINFLNNRQIGLTYAPIICGSSIQHVTLTVQNSNFKNNTVGTLPLICNYVGSISLSNFFSDSTYTTYSSVVSTRKLSSTIYMTHLHFMTRSCFAQNSWMPIQTLIYTPVVTPFITPESTPPYTMPHSPAITHQQSRLPTIINTHERTPLYTPILTPMYTQKRSPIITPEHTPFNTPDQTPVITPRDTFDQTPDQTPILTPFMTPRDTFDQTPDQTPILTPFMTPRDTFDQTPDQTPILTPFMTPRDTFDQTPDQTPILTPFMTPRDTFDQTPFQSPLITCDFTPILTPVDTPIFTFEETLIDTPFKTFDETPWLTPNVTPRLTENKTPYITSECTVNQSPKESPNITPFLTPHNTPHDSLIQSEIQTPINTLEQTLFPSILPSSNPTLDLTKTPSFYASPFLTPFHSPSNTLHPTLRNDQTMIESIIMVSSYYSKSTYFNTFVLSDTIIITHSITQSMINSISLTESNLSYSSQTQLYFPTLMISNIVFQTVVRVSSFFIVDIKTESISQENSMNGSTLIVLITGIVSLLFILSSVFIYLIRNTNDEDSISDDSSMDEIDNIPETLSNTTEEMIVQELTPQIIENNNDDDWLRGGF